MKTQAMVTKCLAKNMAFYTKMQRLSDNRRKSGGLFGRKRNNCAVIGNFDPTDCNCTTTKKRERIGVAGCQYSLARTSHHVWTLLEGRGFSPAEIVAPALYSPRTPRSLQPHAARGAGPGNNQDGLATAGLKPRPQW